MKSYKTPVVIELGSLTDLTLGGGMSNPNAPLDGKGGSTNFMNTMGGNL